MGLSSRSFLLSPDDTLHLLAGTAFMRMLRHEAMARLPDFAGQRIRLASLVVQREGPTPLVVVRRTFAMLDIGSDGLLDVARFEGQQFALVDDLLAPAGQAPTAASSVVDATSRFIARGGSWQPDEALSRRIDAAALGQLRCRRVRVVG